MAPDRDRDDHSDVDGEFRALMEGLRTTLPGVQVLFAFLLTLPFQSAFADLDRTARVAYLIAFGSAAISSILLIAPSVHQRIRAPMTGMERHSPHHLQVAVWLTIAGSGAFLVSLGASIFLVSDLVLAPSWAVVAVVSAALLAGWSWIYLPVVSFQRHR